MQKNTLLLKKIDWLDKYMHKSLQLNAMVCKNRDVLESLLTPTSTRYVIDI